MCLLLAVVWRACSMPFNLNRAGFAGYGYRKKTYPFHRVCGEYISNEVLPFMESLDIDMIAWVQRISPVRNNIGRRQTL
jgi:hypothetical protein